MVFVLLLLLLSVFQTTGKQQPIGVCYGRVANNLPPAQEVIHLYISNGIRKMRIYDPDPATLQALRGSHIELVIGVPNEDIQSLASDAAEATHWVQNNILNYSQDVKFRYIVVGNEINPTSATSQFVLPAMQNIYAALTSANLQSQIKVSTAIELSLLGSSYPPSAGEFNPSSSSYISPIVSFLVNNGAPLLANVYPYFSYIGDTNNVNLGYALFNSSTVVVKDGEYEYQNIFSAQLGALYAALEKVGAPDLEVVVSESGWPSDGGTAATVDNAQAYYKNLINHVRFGTPNRPNQPIETYLFAMFDENQKGPAETERHFGLFTPQKQPKYQISFTNQPYTVKSCSPRLTREGFSFSFDLGVSLQQQTPKFSILVQSSAVNATNAFSAGFSCTS
ncbi:glucan endo-1,3-beta-glucosidase-like [Gastrolobium bilobum]|uniref:glucan endo-1,3-beta-glucosidase-like n=1 Tax=Gastrolobium bilobum TaxID=150636 RepID=UPI002AB19D9E|nr:glucan endo-1,3-beta-glucosidase-like [Gastrolobium bilobum]